ncbi:serine hydrolase domain-containing protein [Streptomyces sp. NPDC090445]|uniref:serine hydrolase domain-containing protein n=1 Tax=Streptomyces sp. NPDC090445 TaxID=3365963 RepID=UPI0038022E28
MLTPWVLFAPQPPTLGRATTGDAALAARVRAAAGDLRGYRGLAVAVVNGDRIRFAGLGDSAGPEETGVDESTAFEAGSLGKPMTGMLLAELAARNEIQLDVPLRQLLPDMRFSDPALGSATLGDLASHRAGLDLMPSDLDMFMRGAGLRILGRDPYRGTDGEDVFAAARNATTSGAGSFRYSNLGMALAGQAAARVVGKPYEELLRQYVLDPLEMRDTRAMHPDTPVPSNSATGYRSTGAVMQHWLSSGYTPAGDVWSTSEDLARLLQAELRGTAPGAEAAVPRFDAGPAGQIGLGWYTTRTQGRDITWHDGETGGFTSYMGFDRAGRQGVVVLSNTNQPVDVIGRRLLGLTPEDPEPARDLPQTVITVLGSLGAVFPVVYVAWRRFPRNVHFAHLGFSVAFGIVLLALLRRVGDWHSVSPAVWASGGAILSAGSLLAVLRRPPPGRGQLSITRMILPALRYGCSLLSLLLLVILFEL